MKSEVTPTEEEIGNDRIDFVKYTLLTREENRSLFPSQSNSIIRFPSSFKLHEFNQRDYRYLRYRWRLYQNFP